MYTHIWTRYMHAKLFILMEAEATIPRVTITVSHPGAHAYSDLN